MRLRGIEGIRLKTLRARSARRRGEGRNGCAPGPGAARRAGKALNDALALNAIVLSLPATAAPPARLKRRLLASVGVERPTWAWVPALGRGSRYWWQSRCGLASRNGSGRTNWRPRAN